MSNESEKPVVEVVQGKYCKLLTFYCNNCKMRHTIAVRAPDDKLSLNFRGDYWPWNGSLSNPALSDNCVAHYTQVDNLYYDCHAFFYGDGMTGGGYVYTLPDGFVATSRGHALSEAIATKTMSRHRLLTVDKWPPLIKPPETK